MTIDELLDDHPDLERDDLLAALECGAVAAGGGGRGPAQDFADAQA